MERTLVLLKPDCVQRRLMGAVIGRFENKGLNILAMKMMHVTPQLARQHYAEHVDKPFYPGLEAFITGAPVVAMVVEGLEAIDEGTDVFLVAIYGYDYGYHVFHLFIVRHTLSISSSSRKG